MNKKNVFEEILEELNQEKMKNLEEKLNDIHISEKKLSLLLNKLERGYFEYRGRLEVKIAFEDCRRIRAISIYDNLITDYNKTLLNKCIKKSLELIFLGTVR